MRILVLDTYASYVSGTLPAGIEAEIILPEELAREGQLVHGYYETPEFHSLLSEYNEPDNVDLIVIGNNQGTGVLYARLIHPELRERTIIVWMAPPQPFDNRPYQELGFTRFCARHDIGQEITSLAGQGQS